MIQRPQTLLLALTGLLYIAMAFGPIWSLHVEPSTITLNSSYAVLTNTIEGSTQVEKEVSTIYLLATCAAGFILSVVCIFLFKNRPLQAKLSALSMGLVTTFVGLTIFIAIPKCKEVIMNNAEGHYQWAFYLCIGVIISNLIANRLIRKDEALVKSVDRIR